MAKIIGIDLGTTNSCVAVVEGGKPVVIPNAEGQRTTPSVVAFTKVGERLVGEPAKRQAVTNAPRTVSSVKRLMGSETRVPIDGKCYTPQELSALILQKLKADAEAYLGEPVTEAVITVPAYFNDAQRQATKDAGRIAGLDVRRIINEPTAAALAYGLDNGRTQTVMVYDLGGGTFDVSLIRIGDGIVQVLSTCGDNFLGGDDFDERIVNWLADRCRAEHGVDLTNDRVAMQRLREEAEKAKKELSSAKQTDINLPFLTMAADGALHLQTTLTRAKFEELCADLIERTALPVRNALSDARLSASDLDQVLLVGGSTRIPAVQAKVVRMTGLEPSKSLNPDECVALGAAVQAGRLGGEMLSGPGEDLLLMDVTPLTWMDAIVNGVPVTPRGGYQVEINALWYNAICYTLKLAGQAGDNKFVKEWKDMPDKVKESFLKVFWNEEKGYLADFVNGGGQNVFVRPNQVIACSLEYSPLSDEMKHGVLDVVKNELLTPKGLRTLAPKNPAYEGTYEGDQATRDRAYHQGTVWPWLLGPYIEANFRLYGKKFAKTARELLANFEEDMTVYGVCSIGEIYDGNPPYTPNGCISQAWSVGEILRSMALLEKFCKDDR